MIVSSFWLYYTIMCTLCVAILLSTCTGNGSVLSYEVETLHGVHHERVKMVVKHTPCAQKNCPQGKCLFKDCSKPTCRGGSCHFIRCDAPSCTGGLCVFEQCNAPLCQGGACSFAESEHALKHGFCEGGSCVVDGEVLDSNMRDQLTM